MARPRLRPEQRFLDIIPLWRVAEKDGTAIYEAGSRRSAIHKMHRLNTYRKELRYVDEITQLDDFIVRVVGTQVHIVPRPRLDLSKITTADGKTYSEVFAETTLRPRRLTREEYNRLWAKQRETDPTIEIPPYPEGDEDE